MAQFTKFKELAAHRDIKPSRCVLLPLGVPDRISEASCLMLCDPNIAPFTWRRQRLSPWAFSLCNISHSFSTAPVIEAIGACILDPTQPWDGIVCTSKLAKSVIEEIWRRWRGYIDARLDHGRSDDAQSTGQGSQDSPLCPADLPVIPLGVETADIASRATPELRQQQRQRLQISDDAILISAHGRHSYYSKVHPLPLF
jgi:starch synthase